MTKNTKGKAGKTPYFAIGNDELDRLPVAGDGVVCKICGKTHPIEFGTSKSLMPDGSWSRPTVSRLAGFYTCGKDTYLASIDGRLI